MRKIESIKGYDLIAEDYSQKRKKPWIPFLKFLSGMEERFPNENVLYGVCCDLGCGSGRHINTIQKYSSIYIGVDSSFNMLLISKFSNPPMSKDQNKINVAKKKVEKIDQKNRIYQHFICCNAEKLPFRKQSFDSIVSIAVLHHIFPIKKLEKTLSELNRVLKNNKFMIISLWSRIGGNISKKIKKMNYNIRMKKNNNMVPLLHQKRIFYSNYNRSSANGKSNKNDVNNINSKINTVEKIKLRSFKDLFHVPWKLIKPNKKCITIYRPYLFFTYNKLQYFNKYFKVILKKIIKINTAETNYFLLLKNE
ncbi:MAG: class I SAM-dependent methyltransferase [Promethearchaeota archaeon]